ncbi:MAG TPA: hypothetical protein VEC99_12605, partial [Clostridia bacterium]|nr:hypothetical protein [Clostridia bacterium]
GTHPLCKLFTKSFKTDNNLTPAAITELVKAIQLTVQSIHDDGCLVVDLNELNVLVGSSFVEPFMIDTDSYQTPSYRATAIMDSIRDRLSPPGQFSPLTDWFSFAVIATQLYLNIHPFKGTHPKYLPSELSRRMDDNVSIFDPQVQLPMVCNPFSVIPKQHFEWLKAAFLRKERSIPPLPDVSCPIPVPASIVMVKGTEKFEVSELFALDDDILLRTEFFGVDYFVTRRSVYKGTTRVWDRAFKYRRVVACPTVEDELVIAAVDDQGKIEFITPDNQCIGQASSRGMFQRNQAVYTINQGYLYENTFIKMGTKTLVRTQAVDNVSEFTAHAYPGLVVQDLLGKFWVTIPYAAGKSRTQAIPELNGYRIIDARSEKNVCVLVGERKGTYYRFILTFAADFASYALRVEADIAYEGINFTVLENGLCILLSRADELQVFKGNTVHKFENPPIDANMRLFTKGGGVYFLNGNSVFSFKMAK